MKKFILLLAATSVMSLSAFANSTYKSTETTTTPSGTVKEEQQRMEDDSRMKMHESTIKKDYPRDMDKKVEKVEKKTSKELAE